MIEEMSPNWYLLYVKARNENKIVQQLMQARIDCYLPQIKLLKQWHDRKKYVETPLFPSYIFVNPHSSAEFFACQAVKGVCYFVKTEKKAVRISNTVIEQIRLIVNNGNNVEVSEHYFRPGSIVQIEQGALKGLSCEIMEQNGKCKVLVRVNFLNRTIILDMPISYLREQVA